MMQKIPIKIAASALMLCVAWLWYSSDSDSTSNAIAAPQESGSTTAQVTGKVSGVIFRNGDLNDDLASKFKTAVELIDKDQNQDAIGHLNDIIEQQPQAIEPYINLAALHAKSNEIDKASETLKKAISANKNTSILFESLQALYAAQAALAYQRALEIKTIDDQALAVSLPTISTLMVDKPSGASEALNEKNQQLVSQVADGERKLAALEAQLAEVDQQRTVLLSSNAQLKEQSTQQSLVGGNKEKAQNELVSKLKLELLEAEQKNEDLVQQHQVLIAQLKSESNTRISELENQVELASNATTAQVVAAVEVNTPTVNLPSVDQSSDQSEVAIGLVKAWASSWESQDVASYISFYQSDFRPTSGASNKNWRAQRKIRLTNKSYIDVEVGDFKVKDLDERFEVVFLQHYKSNNVDDRIIKRLVFDKSGSDWAKAKISAEQVVSN